MKRLSADFYAKVHTLRDAVGEAEYDRDEKLLLPVVALLRAEKRDELMLRDAANQILDNMEKAEDEALQGTLFPYSAHIALGDKRRIKRGAMNLEQHYRRKRLIDANHAAQTHGWDRETRWLNEGIDALEDRPRATKRSDVLTEQAETAAKGVV
jgi:hypothetical protein